MKGGTERVPQSFKAKNHNRRRTFMIKSLLLVEELKSARARALAAGGQLPRAVEAAASALEPLLRLRDVTGAACDLTAMPWLPQLLTVFRNVLRTAVDGVGSSRATGGNAGEDTARMAQAAAAAAAAISALGADPQLSRMECDLLRDQIKKQDSELKIAKQRERELQRQLEQVQQQRDQLLNKESDGGNWFARRVVDLEREQSEWNTEKQSVEVKISVLVTDLSVILLSYTYIQCIYVYIYTIYIICIYYIVDRYFPLDSIICLIACLSLLNPVMGR